MLWELTGVSATSVGSVTAKLVMYRNINRNLQLHGVGSLSPADVMGLTGQSITSSVGSISPADVMGLTGVSATS